MNGYVKDIDILLELKHPSPNRITDLFGYHRHWGKDTWTPDEGYSPIHAGIDYSARGDTTIYAPCDCLAWGDRVEGSVGSYIMMRPIRADGRPSPYLALYYYHCEPTGQRWRQFNQGDAMTVHSGYGVGAPHLHFEVAASDALGKYMVDTEVLQEDWVTLSMWDNKARINRLSRARSILEVRETMRRWQIRGMYNDFFIRATIPDYRRSQHSKLGFGYTYIIDPTLFIGE